MSLVADPEARTMPEIQGRISIDQGGGNAFIKGFAVRNNNPRDPWGSTVEVCGARNVHIEGCQLLSSGDDETVLLLHGGCSATICRNLVQGGSASGATGVSVEGSSTVTFHENTVSDHNVGFMLQPSVTAMIVDNVISRNQKSIMLSEEGMDAIVDHGGFGRVKLLRNTFTDNRDGHNDASFLKTLELLLHPLLHRNCSTSKFNCSTSKLSFDRDVSGQSSRLLPDDEDVIAEWSRVMSANSLGDVPGSAQEEEPLLTQDMGSSL